MSTLHSWFNPTSGLILGLQTLRDYLLTPLRETLAAAWVDLWGTGGLIIGTTPSFTISSSRLTLDADLTAWTGTGYRLSLDNAAGKGFASIPFEDEAGPYYLGARYNERPAGTTLGFDGVAAYTAYTEAIGELYTPTSVAVTGSAEITVTMTSAIPAAMKWSNSAYSRPVVVWLVDGPASDSSAAIHEGSLVKDGSAYKVVIPSLLGQTVPSTTASAYRVLVLGLTVSATALGSAYVALGQVSSSAYADTGATVVSSFGDYVSAFVLEHNLDGTHSDITAGTVTADIVTANDGFYAGKDNTSEWRYQFTGTYVDFRYNLAPWLGGWMYASGDLSLSGPPVFTIDASANARWVAANISGSLGVTGLVYNLNPLIGGRNVTDTPTSDPMKIVSFGFGGYRGDASDDASFKLVKYHRGTQTPTTLGTATLTAGASTWKTGTVSLGTAEQVDLENYDYYLYLVIDQAGGGSSEMRVDQAFVTLRRYAMEG
jgi:hypothetical protein